MDSRLVDDMKRRSTSLRERAAGLTACGSRSEATTIRRVADALWMAAVHLEAYNDGRS